MLGSTVDTWSTVAAAVGTIGAVAYTLFCARNADAIRYAIPVAWDGS